MSYSLVSDPSIKRGSLSSLWSRKRLDVSHLPVLIAAALAGTLLLLIASGTAFSHPPDVSHLEQVADGPPGILHVIIPANRPETNLCKNMIGATILGYPMPALINWGKIIMDPKLVEGGTHIAKISGTLDYLNGLDANRPDDLVLLVDGYDVWFQLRPHVLLTRYFEINKQADERMMSMYAGTKQHKGLHQKTIFSAEKRCWPWEPEDPPCYATPDSTLPNDIYGPGTGEVIDDGHLGDYSKMRQRYLNSGVVLGTVSSLRSIFQRAKEIAERDSNFGSDQQIFGRVFGEQEVWRHDYDSALQTANAANVDDYDMSEYGLGLDYESKLGFATVASDHDAAWVTYADNSSIRAAQGERQIPAGNKRLEKMEADVAGSRPPYWMETTEPALPKDKGWKDVQLLTNAWTGITPAIIHHNGNKSAREFWWDHVWYQKQAKELLAAEGRQPLQPLAYAGGRYWWAEGKNRGGAMVERDEKWVEVPYGEVCNDLQDLEVFRDHPL